MNKIFIKQELFDLDNSCSSKLFSSIFNLYKYNFDIILSPGADKIFTKILQNEGIDYKYSNSLHEFELPTLSYKNKIILKSGEGRSKNSVLKIFLKLLIFSLKITERRKLVEQQMKRI